MHRFDFLMQPFGNGLHVIAEAGDVVMQALDLLLEFDHFLYLHFKTALPVIVRMSINTVIMNDAAHACACQSS